MLKILSFLAILISCSSHQITRNPSSAPHQKTWGKYLHDEFFAHQGLKHFFAEAEYLIMPWQRNRDIVFHKPLAPYQVQVKPLSCKSKKLYPTHPQQSTKDYLHAAWAGYQHHKVPINSSVCIQPNPSRRYCLNSTFANVVVFSDTFQDSCQNLYRGYWVVTYLKKR